MVIETGGARTLSRSLSVIRLGGNTSIIGILEKQEEQLDPIYSIIGKAATLRGIYVGSKSMFQNMNNFIASLGIMPELDRIFAFENTFEAYPHLASDKHFGKVVVSLDQ